MVQPVIFIGRAISVAALAVACKYRRTVVADRRSDGPMAGACAGPGTGPGVAFIIAVDPRRG